MIPDFILSIFGKPDLAASAVETALRLVFSAEARKHIGTLTGLIRVCMGKLYLVCGGILLQLFWFILWLARALAFFAFPARPLKRRQTRASRVAEKSVRPKCGFFARAWALLPRLRLPGRRVKRAKVRRKPVRCHVGRAVPKRQHARRLWRGS